MARMFWRASVDSACAVIWKPPSPQMTSGRRASPPLSFSAMPTPMDAATEWPIEAQTALATKLWRPTTFSLPAEYWLSEVSVIATNPRSRAPLTARPSSS